MFSTALCVPPALCSLGQTASGLPLLLLCVQMFTWLNIPGFSHGPRASGIPLASKHPGIPPEGSWTVKLCNLGIHHRH